MKLPKLSIVKIGGEILNDTGRKDLFLARFSAMKGPKILVHGGGKQASNIASQMGIEAKMLDGRRITDSENLDIALMVYAGLLNKKLVAELQSLGNSALGISGTDGDAIRAAKRPSEPIDFGYAGDIESVNTDFLHLLLENNLTPVMCALTHDGLGQMLNTNADTIASETAIAMSSLYETSLFYVFDKPGVLTDVQNDDSVISKLDIATYRKMRQEQLIFEGMIPKLDNGFHALNNSVSHVLLGDQEMLSTNSAKATRMEL